MADKNLEDLYKSIYEKKADKDYDGDGKVESGSKEHAGAVHNAIQRKKGLKPDGQDTRREEVEYVEEDSRRMSNKQHTKRVKQNIKAFGSNFTPPNNWDPDANRGQGEVVTRKQMEKKRRKALRQEEVEVEEGYKEIDAKKHGRMYDRYKKLRSAAMQDARDSGEASGENRMKMGKMSTVIDKSSENLRKKQTRDQLTGRG